jgi:sulfur carrier protein
MRIFLNGLEQDVPAPQTVQSLLELSGVADRRVAVEVNLEVVPRGQHPRHVLVEGDRVELIQAIGGG